jgi:hypothetical protein
MGRPLLPSTAIAFVIVAVLSFAASQALAGPAASGPAADHRAAPNHRVSHSASSNWSGYAVAGFGPYASVSSRWTQPAVECKKTPNGWSAFWVGLDGDTTETVEQTGTEADCSSGTAVYGAWYEMYPKYPVNFPTTKDPVLPGDTFTASVTHLAKGKFKLVLSDTTRGWSRTVSKRLRSARLGSAEAIAEAPTGGEGVLPLADFGTVGFSEFTVNGSLVTGSMPGLEPITMVSAKGKAEATPSEIGSGSFSDTWDSK